MNTEFIISVLLSAAAYLKKPIQDVAGQSIKDIYDAARHYMRRKFGEGSDGAKFLELATAKPESAMRKAVLAEEVSSVGLVNDPDLVGLMEQLAALLPEHADSVRQSVRVNGHTNKVLVAGRDVITAERVVHRSAIVPNERHLSASQRSEMRALVADVAVRLAGDDSRPNFAAVHEMLRRQFQVLSYALIPRDRFDDAIRFLKRQRAIHRSRLRTRNSVAWRHDLYRAAYGCARELGWGEDRVRQFAQEKLGLEKPLMSVNDLSPLQLKSLADLLHRHLRTVRAAAGSKLFRFEARQEKR